MARRMKAELRSGTVQARRAAKDVESQLQRVSRAGARAMKGVAGRAAGLVAALSGVVKLLDTAYQRRQAASSIAAADTQPQQTGAQRNRDIADRAWRLFRRTRREASAPAEDRGRTVSPADPAGDRIRPISGEAAGRTAQIPPGGGPQSGAGDEPPTRKPGRFEDIPAGRGTAVVQIGTYYGYKPHDAATNTETRTGD